MTRLVLSHLAAAVLSLLVFRVACGGSVSLNFIDANNVDRHVQVPVLLAFSLLFMFLYAVVTSVGMLRVNQWALKISRLMPIIVIPLWMSLVWLVARIIRLREVGCYSTDPASQGNIIPLVDFQIAVLILFPLWLAISFAYWRALRALAAARADEQQSSSAGRILWSSLKTAVVVVALILALANFKMPDGRRFIHDAADYGWTSVVAALVHLGQDVNLRGSNGYTPLHFAADAGRVGTLDYLLDEGADIDAQDSWGDTPAMAAAEAEWSLWDRNNPDCYSALLRLIKRNANVRVRNHEGLTVANKITWRRCYPVELVQMLVERGVPINIDASSLYTEFTLIGFAVERGKPEDVDYLLSH